MLTDSERDAIERVLASLDIRFDKLVALAGLDPREDFRHAELRALNFCGADLRGYDFSGSDLRDTVIDGNTLIDETTILDGANVRWLDAEDIPIVSLMSDVQTSSAASARADALAELEKRFGKSDHVLQFVINAAAETDSLEVFLDYLDFLPTSVSRHHMLRLINNGERLLRKHLARAKARTRRETTKMFATAKLLERLSEAKDSLSGSWFNKIAFAADERKETQALKGVVFEPNEELLIASLRSLA